MSWDQLAGKWTQSKGKIKEKWTKLSENDVQEASGSRDQFVLHLQERYGFTEAEAGRQADLFARSVENGARQQFQSAAAGGSRGR